MNTSEQPRCIISLAYDGALPSHFESVAPLLEEHGLRGTFYTPCSPAFFDNIEAWREVATQGHELGNHALFEQGPADSPYQLSNYSVRRWTDEIRLANSILTLVDGREARSFGNPGCLKSVGGSGKGSARVERLASGLFSAARGSYSGNPVDLDNINWFALETRDADNESFENLRAEIDRMCLRGGWFILAFHDVGRAGGARGVEEEEHTRLVEWLATRQDAIWTAPVRVVAEALRPSRRTFSQSAR